MESFLPGQRNRAHSNYGTRGLAWACYHQEILPVPVPPQGTASTSLMRAKAREAAQTHRFSARSRWPAGAGCRRTPGCPRPPSPKSAPAGSSSRSSARSHPCCSWLRSLVPPPPAQPVLSPCHRMYRPMTWRYRRAIRYSYSVNQARRYWYACMRAYNVRYVDVKTRQYICKLC